MQSAQTTRCDRSVFLLVCALLVACAQSAASVSRSTVRGHWHRRARILSAPVRTELARSKRSQAKRICRRHKHLPESVVRLPPFPAALAAQHRTQARWGEMRWLGGKSQKQRSRAAAGSPKHSRRRKEGEGGTGGGADGSARALGAGLSVPSFVPLGLSVSARLSELAGVGWMSEAKRGGEAAGHSDTCLCLMEGSACGGRLECGANRWRHEAIRLPAVQTPSEAKQHRRSRRRRQTQTLD
jgi:hypothetical protein